MPVLMDGFPAAADRSQDLINMGGSTTLLHVLRRVSQQLVLDVLCVCEVGLTKTREKYTYIQSDLCEFLGM